MKTCSYYSLLFDIYFMRNSPFWWILIGFMVLVDAYFFQALKSVSHGASQRTRAIIYIIYWVISIAAIVVLLLLPYMQSDKQFRFFKSSLFAIIAGLFFAKSVASLFFLVDDLRRGLQWMFSKFSFPAKEFVKETNGISRSAFLSWAGIIAGSGLFGNLIYGFANKYRYQLVKQKLQFDNLPAAFKGLRVIQISDIHSGSFNNKKAVMKGVEKIMNEKPDLILFTGDLVNNVANEMDDYIEVFEKLQAQLGVYAILGNHDYGDYVQWENSEQKIANLEKLKQVHAALGWRLLMNEHVRIERGGETISILGVENWSAKARFPKYGDLNKAYTGTKPGEFKILMSHDPSHWKAEVLKRYPDISLMLAGHTHGMQFGVELPGIKWSPIQYMYKEWAGLYEAGAQKLYVNRGFGFLGYPGRVGILPEITLFELT